jgi:two-component system sensor histidine kinase KdpD
MSRLESGTLTVRKELQPLEEIIGSALNQLEKQLKLRPLRVSLPADLPLVPADSVLMEQVFVNLLENALKYTPAETPLSLGARDLGQEIEAEVADQGPGLAEEELEKVFAPYYRNPARAGQAGYGLGLAICRAIVKAHGGRVWAANRPGGGAAFRFVLPLEGSKPEATGEAGHDRP